jgi:hypothetical protein
VKDSEVTNDSIETLHQAPSSSRYSPDDDSFFSDPYVDLDEWRDAPSRHRYVHGGFAGTETRFSIYLPPAEQYEGRFFQHITPVPDSENLAPLEHGGLNKIGVAISSGAYYVETNGGGGPSGQPGSDIDPTIAAYRANAAAAQYSRVVAAQMYGDHRPFGYAYGGSGGGYRTIGAAENTVGVWDGYAPYVIGSPMSIPNVFSVRMHAQRLLRDCFDSIVDALEPGGSGDMYAGLDDDQRDALLEVTRMGFPPRSWYAHRTMGMHAFPVLYSGVRMADPSYFEDFWTQPGYLGATAPASLVRDRVQHRCEVAALLTFQDLVDLGLATGTEVAHGKGGVDDAFLGGGGGPETLAAVRLSSPAPREMQGGDLLVTSGLLARIRLALTTAVGDVAIFDPSTNLAALTRLQPGDSLEVDNSGFLAAQTYHRHQVPGPDYAVWDQFRDHDGSPIYPQRPMLLGPLFAAAAAGTVQTGRIDGKMIVVAALHDREAFPWQADWYRSKVQEQLGEATDDSFRLWYVDNAIHADDEIQAYPTHTISYLGVLHQALRDLSAWVEKGIAPTPSTNYVVADGQVVVPDTAAERGGLQAVPALIADGGIRSEVAVGETVTLRVVAEVPPSAGQITAVEWDLDGVGDFPITDTPEPGPRVTVERECRFAAPGTYFPTVRVTSQRDGDTSDPYARIQNLARVRIVVS